MAQGELTGRLGFVALTIGELKPAILADETESTLPIPQFISNWRRKSCYGFRSSTLAGWLFGDAFKYASNSVRKLTPEPPTTLCAITRSSSR